jgi:hypothetical protein
VASGSFAPGQSGRWRLRFRNARPDCFQSGEVHWLNPSSFGLLTCVVQGRRRGPAALRDHRFNASPSCRSCGRNSWRSQADAPRPLRFPRRVGSSIPAWSTKLLLQTEYSGHCAESLATPCQSGLVPGLRKCSADLIRRIKSPDGLSPTDSRARGLSCASIVNRAAEPLAMSKPVSDEEGFVSDEEGLKARLLALPPMNVLSASQPCSRRRAGQSP